MNILWVKCTSHGRGYIYKLEEYILKNREVNLIGNLDEDVPHNTMPFILKESDVYYKDCKINLESIHQAIFIFCCEEEVITSELREYLIKFETILLTHSNISFINQPSKIINLNSKTHFYNLLQSNNVNHVPMFTEIYSNNDLNAIDYFPVILRQDQCWGGKGMIKCNNKNDLINAYNSMDISRKIFVVQYLDSKYNEYDNVLIRIIVVNRRFIINYAVAGNDWNVHTSTGFNKSTFSQLNKSIRKFINEELIERIIDVIGPGTYGFDCCIHNNKLIFLEANSKIFLATYQIPIFHKLDSNLFENFMDDNLRNKIITDALIPMTVTDNNIVYVPFGFNCIAANTLKNMNMKQANVLLDYITSNPEGIIKLLKSKSFDEFMNKENLYIDSKTVHCKYSKFKYNHQFHDGLNDYEMELEKLERGYLRLKETIENKDIVLITVSNWKNIDEYHNERLFHNFYELNNQLLTIRKGKPYKWYIFNKYLTKYQMINAEFIDLKNVIDETLDENENRKIFEYKLQNYLNSNVLQHIAFPNNDKINNNIQVNEIYDGYECIHGDELNVNEIEFTIFLITIHGDQCKYAIESINSLPTNINVKVHIIYKNAPTSVAYEQMHIRCTTKYYIQMDEDMYIFSDKWHSFMDDCKENIKGDVFNYSFRLIDTVDGVGKEKWLYGIKCFKTEVMKDVRYEYGTTSVDRSFNKIALDRGLMYKLSKEVVGTHAKYRSNFELFIKSGKFITSLLNNSIKISCIDVIRLTNRLYNNNKIVLNAIIDDCIKMFGSNEKNLNFVKKKIEYICALYNEEPTYSQIKKYEFDIVDTKNIILFKDNCHINTATDETYYSIYGIIYFILNDFKYEYTKYPRDNFKLIERIN